MNAGVLQPWHDYGVIALPLDVPSPEAEPLLALFSCAACSMKYKLRGPYLNYLSPALVVRAYARAILTIKDLCVEVQPSCF